METLGNNQKKNARNVNLTSVKTQTRKTNDLEDRSKEASRTEMQREKRMNNNNKRNQKKILEN